MADFPFKGSGGLLGEIPPHDIDIDPETHITSKSDHDMMISIIKLGQGRKTIMDCSWDNDIPVHLRELLRDDLIFVTERDKLAQVTRDTYENDWRRFRGYAIHHQLPFLPATPAAVAQFLIDEYWDCVVSDGYIGRILSALSWFHELGLHPDPTKSVIVKAARHHLDRLREGMVKAENIIAEAAPEDIEIAEAEYVHETKKGNGISNGKDH